MKIYTKTGDAGETGLFGGARVSKADLRVAAYGDVDELNSVLGMCRRMVAPDIDALLETIQGELFCLGAELATVPGKREKLSLPSLEEEHCKVLEEAIDAFEEELEPLKSFVLPGGSEGASRLHLGRTVCRRAERSCVALAGHSEVRGEMLRYLNRLSDLLFVLARVSNRRAGVEDVPWNP